MELYWLILSSAVLLGAQGSDLLGFTAVVGGCGDEDVLGKRGWELGESGRLRCWGGGLKEGCWWIWVILSFILYHTLFFDLWLTWPVNPVGEWRFWNLIQFWEERVAEQGGRPAWNWFMFLVLKVNVLLQFILAFEHLDCAVLELREERQRCWGRPIQRLLVILGQVQLVIMSLLILWCTLRCFFYYWLFMMKRPIKTILIEQRRFQCLFKCHFSGIAILVFQ